MYLINEVASILGISRTTLLYYIEQGVVHPDVDELTGYRYFSERDISTLKHSTALRNIGMSVKEIAAYLRSDDAESRTEKLQALILEKRRKIEREQAFLDEAQALIEPLSPMPEPEIVESPAYYYCYTGCETGYHFLTHEPESIAVLRNVPVGKFSMVFDAHFWDDDPVYRYKTGRAISGKDAEILRIDTANMQKMGGQLCVHWRIEGINNNKDHQRIRRLKSYIREQHLKITGDPFCPGYVSYRPDKQQWMDIYVPVERAAERV